MLVSILAFLAKIGIGSIVGKLADARLELAKAETDDKRIAAQERIKTLEARRDVMIAEGGSRINALMRAFIAVGPALYLFKIFVIDKVLGWGRTDDLSDQLWQVVIYVLGFYFLVEGATTVTRIIKRKG